MRLTLAVQLHRIKTGSRQYRWWWIHGPTQKASSRWITGKRLRLQQWGHVLDAEQPTDVVVGHLAAGVPGTVSGMSAAHQRFGTLPWADLVRPAVELAEGFEVKERFLGSLSKTMVEALSAYPTSARQFLPRDGSPPVVGDTLRQADLASTLNRIKDEGETLYRPQQTHRRRNGAAAVLNT